MSDKAKVAFEAGSNIAMKVPPGQHAATVAFYRDILGLAVVDDGPGSVGFRFGAITLWIDSTPDLEKAETWLEVTCTDTAAAAEYLAAAGVARRDEVEKLPPDLDGFWIANPAGVIHLVDRAGGD